MSESLEGQRLSNCPRLCQASSDEVFSLESSPLSWRTHWAYFRMAPCPLSLQSMRECYFIFGSLREKLVEFQEIKPVKVTWKHSLPSTCYLLLTHFSVLPLCAGDSAPGKETWIAAPQSSKWVQEKPLLLSPLPQISLSGQVRQFPSFSHSTVESSSPRGTLRAGSGRASMVSPIEKAPFTIPSGHPILRLL